MPFSTPRRKVTSYLVLRQLYDGDVIEWPLPDDDPHRPLFDALEQQGYLARWNRMWPLADRYRLTEKGIAMLEAVYNPGQAEALFENIRARQLGPAERRAQLQAARIDPEIWPALHDPFTHWNTFQMDEGHYHRFFWEDALGPRRVTTSIKPAPDDIAPSAHGFGRTNLHHDPHYAVVDLDSSSVDPGFFATAVDSDIS